MAGVLAIQGSNFKGYKDLLNNGMDTESTERRHMSTIGNAKDIISH